MSLGESLYGSKCNSSITTHMVKLSESIHGLLVSFTKCSITLLPLSPIFYIYRDNMSARFVGKAIKDSQEPLYK